MHYNVSVTVRYTSVLFGKGDGVSKEFFGDGRVEVCVGVCLVWMRTSWLRM